MQLARQLELHPTLLLLLLLLLSLPVEFCQCLQAPCTHVRGVLNKAASSKQGANIGKGLKGDCRVGEVQPNFTRFGVHEASKPRYATADVASDCKDSGRRQLKWRHSSVTQ